MSKAENPGGKNLLILAIHFMRQIFFSIVCFLIINSGYTQSLKDSVTLSDSIKRQASAMADFLVDKNYTQFIKYMHPKTVNDGGGSIKVLKLISESLKTQEEKGFSLLNVGIGEPLMIFKVKNEFQCTVPQTLTLKVPGGKLISISTLIGVSFDNGKNWKFIDASDKDIPQMRKIYPTLSKNLIIPEKEKPVFYKE